MNIEILRLHELSEKQLLAYGEWLRGDIKPGQEVGSDWVCRERHKRGYWSDKYIAEMAEKTKEEKTRTVDVRVALVDGKVVGTHWCSRGNPDRSVTLFDVDASLSQKDRDEVGFALALSGARSILEDTCPGKENIVIWLPENSAAWNFAKLCEFEFSPVESVVANVKPLVSAKKPVKELVELLEKKSGYHHG